MPTEPFGLRWLTSYRVRAALRIPVILFFLLTTCYALLAYIPFTYLQFLRHELFAWLRAFIIAHYSLYWGALLLALLSVIDDLRAGRRAAWGFAGVFGVIGVWQLIRPSLPQLGSDRRSLIVALAALAPLVWLSAIDHLATRGVVRWRTRSATRRLLGACAWTASYVWLTFAAIAAVRLALTGAARLDPGDHLLAVAWSLPLHLTLAGAGFAAVAVARAGARRLHLGSCAEYALLAAGLAAAGWLALTRLVFPPMAFRGALASLTAAILGACGAFVWSGLARRRAAEHPDASGDPLETLVAPAAPFASPGLAAAWLAGLAGIAYALIEGVAQLDWHFLMQKLIAASVWGLAFATAYRVARDNRGPTAGLVMGVSALLVGACLLVGRDSRLVSRFPFAGGVSRAVDRYAAYDASLTLVAHLTRPASSELADLVEFLVASSNLAPGRGARPASIDFVQHLEPSGAPRPHVFIFVVDSLRRDYLSPYNPAVTFTPAIQAFAEESLLFTHAFTRYSGTGLAEPSIWAGALLPHQQYVTPFAPMNALEKLLNVEGYRRLISVDSILKQLLTPSPAVRELDAGILNRLYDSCRTFTEIRAALPVSTDGGSPLFAFTQPQDLHLVNVQNDRTPVPQSAYPGFTARYAARLRRLDGCFGMFLDHLKQAGLYSRSVVVLTSDHGDSLGEEGRWGHAYTVFPEVVRVPLIIHVPDALGGRLAGDPSVVAFTTDITPTLYRLLGHRPVARGRMFGTSLVGASAETLADRREAAHLIASSYGPVYGLLRENGRILYIVDGVNTAEYQYDLSRGLNGTRIVPTDAERAANWREIREQIAEVATFYGID